MPIWIWSVKDRGIFGINLRFRISFLGLLTKQREAQSTFQEIEGSGGVLISSQSV